MKDEQDGRLAAGGAWGPSSRREFLKLAAAGAAALGLTSAMSGCVLTAAGRRKLDFHDDFGVLNYAYALECLESRFYERVVASPPSDLRPGELELLREIGAHEIEHRRFFNRALFILRPKARSESRSKRKDAKSRRARTTSTTELKC